MTLILREFFVSSASIAPLPEKRKGTNGSISVASIVKGQVPGKTSQRRQGKIRHTRAILRMYTRRACPSLYIDKTGAPYSFARCCYEIFQVSSSGQSKCVLYMRPTIFIAPSRLRGAKHASCLCAQLLVAQYCQTALR